MSSLQKIRQKTVEFHQLAAQPEECAVGDPLGGCRITPYGYSVMLKKLMEFAEGKIVMALEGGYNLDSIANSVLACVEVLVEEKPLSGSSEAYPFESTWRVIQAVREKLSPFWPILKFELSKKLTDGKAPPIQISCSDSDGENDICANIVSEDLEKAVQDILQPFSELRVDEVSTVSAPWRLELSKIDVWYATFGSNMCKSRFLCYIQGGQVEGMRKACAGSLDKSPPKEILWKTVPHRLFFGRDQTKTWGPGGVAFLHPESNSQNRAYMCLYRITLEQFNDVLLQENVSRFDLSSPVFDLTDLDSIMEKGKPVEVLERGWYRNVVHLGNESGIPILTMTCTLSDVESFKSGLHPLCAPAKEYADTLVRGLVGGNQFSEEEAMAYILEASTNPL
ncbi:hypothetical protein RHGRI_024033 [Rhododendron griersonianum]|uniref:Histone deacetylase domain-containing protein n=1 Tax=Rhododendron griersonianum TaxID=479676 RepID=A0AAV6J830_9ERIC|nr:hypothetical protein RHGRI_024033 [Rhododendron griersonianum]